MRSDESSGYEELSSILNTLGDPTALKILNEAAKGFSSGNEVIKKLGLTPRKYYRCLERLGDHGIIAPSGKEYHLTYFGKYLHNVVFNHILSLLSRDLETLESLPRFEGICELTIVDDYNELMKLLNVLIEKSKHEVLVATRYVDLSVAQSLLNALERGVKVKSVSNEKLNLSSLLELLKGMTRFLRPNSISLLFNNPDYRVGDVPLSFILIDDEIGVFEIPSQEFKMAFYTLDKKVLIPLSSFFHGLWNKSKGLQIRFPKRM